MNSNKFVIREATSGDTTALGPLAAELGYPNDTAQTTRRLLRVMEAQGHRVLVAEDTAHQIIGWVHVFGSPRVESDGFAELGGLVVTESWRRRGVGKQLVTGASRWAVDRGYSKLRIRSRIERTDAHDFFVRLGYVARKTQLVFERPLIGEQ